MNAANTSRHRDAGADYHSYCQDGRNEDSESEEESHNYYSYQQGQDTPRGEAGRHDVNRSWQSTNPRVKSVLEDPALRGAIDIFEGRVSRHNRSSSRQSRPTATHRHRSPDQYRTNSRPLGYSNVRSLNESRSPQRPIERRLREDQRNGPYDAVQSVGQRSDYDRRGQHASSGHNGAYRRSYEDEDEEEYEYEHEWDEGRRSDNYR